MVRFMFLGVGATLLGFSCRADAWGGGKKKDEEPEMPTGKDAVDLGRAGFRQVAGDVGLMNDLLKDLEDPETLKEVEKLMNDKNFKKEMNKLMESDEWKNGATDATNFLQDPKAMEAMAKKTKEYTDFIAAGPGKDGKRDAAMGLNAASAAMMDPNFMKDAMEMMKDPAVMKQVEETMKNPEFMKQMKEVMDNPVMKEQLAKAGANMEELMKNPELMAEAQRQMQAMMGGAAAA
ncbi:unnamed protein product [Ectocarpus sp. 12 AP-2014]